MVSVGQAMRLLMLMCVYDVIMMTGTGSTGASLVVAATFGDAFRATEQRTHQPEHAALSRNEAERGADFRLSPCCHFFWLGRQFHIEPSKI